MASRIRSRGLDLTIGLINCIWVKPGVSKPLGLASTISANGFETVRDSVHPYPYLVDGSLQLNRVKTTYGRVTGTRKTSYWHHRGDNLPVLNPVELVEMYKPLGDQIVEATIKARNYGSKPVVNVPLAIAELKDLPKMIQSLKQAWRRQLSVGDATLSWNFGVAPLLDDLMKLQGLQASMAKQMKRVNKAVETGKISQQLKAKPYPSYNFGRSYSVVRPLAELGNVRVTETLLGFKGKAWFSARATPIGWSMKDRLDLTSTWHQAGFNNAQASTIYNLVPWSFLVDYFTNLGDWVSLLDNRFHWKLGRMCVMNRLTVNARLDVAPITVLHDASYENGDKVYEFKDRDVALPDLGLTFTDMLEPKQLANAFALGTGLKRNSRGNGGLGSGWFHWS